MRSVKALPGPFGQALIFGPPLGGYRTQQRSFDAVCSVLESAGRFLCNAEISGNRLVKWFNSMPGIRHNGGIDWDILILQLIYKKTLKDKTPGETCVSFSLPGTLVIDLCHMISLGQWCLMKISSDLKTTSLADLQKWLTTGIPWIWRMNLFIKVITCYNML